MEDHIATFNYMPEDEVIGHDVLESRVEDRPKEQTEEIKLHKNPWYKDSLFAEF